MMDLLIGIVDRLISLVKVRQEARTGAFKELIDPLFVELQQAYLEYMRSFITIKDALRKNELGLSEIAEQARDLRTASAALRHKVQELARSYQRSPWTPQDIRDFLTGAPTLFSSLSMNSVFLSLVTELDSISSSKQSFDRAYVVHFIDDVLDRGLS